MKKFVFTNRTRRCELQKLFAFNMISRKGWSEPYLLWFEQVHVFVNKLRIRQKFSSTIVNHSAIDVDCVVVCWVLYIIFYWLLQQWSHYEVLKIWSNLCCRVLERRYINAQSCNFVHVGMVKITCLCEILCVSRRKIAPLCCCLYQIGVDSASTVVLLLVVRIELFAYETLPPHPLA